MHVITRCRPKYRKLLCAIGVLAGGVSLADERSQHVAPKPIQPLIVLPGGAPRYTGPQGREADVTELLATSAQTGGKLGMFLQTIAPGSGPPTHLHTQIEFAYVLSGQFTFKAGDRIASVPVGTFIVIPPNTVHAFKNTGSAPGQLLFGVIPGGFETMFSERQGVDAATNKKLTEKYEHVVGPPLP